ncbi:hypothetical protein AX17_004445 [Amanita inopinata Kibby_2008]|nr:hypothetical protein AX17_004445 [Amanita inopinata Kibby_2008]
MGVHGLTTFLHENKRALSRTFQLNSRSLNATPTSVIIDGWSFIYKLYYDSNLPWVYGGEYIEFYRLIIKTVQAWIDLGLKVYFVFDGPCPKIKFPTVASRLNQTQVHHSLLFFRTSSIPRSTARFLHETRIIPPLAYLTCVCALQSLAQTATDLDIHYADEEGDPYAVELAGRVGGYVVGNDSDFVILNSEGYKGYIPLDEMVWLIPDSASPTPGGDSDGEFQTIRKPKAKKKANSGSGADKGIIPPSDDTQELTLSFVVYSPDLLASHLKIPVTLLPLFGAIVGNDFSGRFDNARRNVQSLFFERQLTLSQRIQRVAVTMQSILKPGPHKKRAKHHVGSVMDLIDQIVNTLLSRWLATLGSGEAKSIIEGVANATLQYAIPRYQGSSTGKESLWPTAVCALHDPESCQLLPILSRLLEDDAISMQDLDTYTQQKIELRGMYLAAYRKGILSGKVMDILSTASFWPRLFLENPDIETVGRSIGRPIRTWIYAILADALGLPTAATSQSGVTTESSVPEHEATMGVDDDDEIVDVVEEDSEDESDGYTDLLAPLRGQLQQLHSPQQHEDGGSGVSEQQTISKPSKPRRHVPPDAFKVTEYLRRGTRVAEEMIDVESLNDLLTSINLPQFCSDKGTPLLLRPQTDALSVLLSSLGSDTPSVRVLHREQLSVTLSIRWVLQALHRRAGEANSKARDLERWTEREARCFLSTFMWTSDMNGLNDSSVNSDAPPIQDRNVQLMAQILMALDSVNDFANALLIPDLVPPVVQLFSGKRFHLLLCGMTPLDDDLVPTALWDACRDGLEESFTQERKKRSKAVKKAAPTAPMPIAMQTSQGSLFSMLAEGSA